MNEHDPFLRFLNNTGIGYWAYTPSTDSLFLSDESLKLLELPFSKNNLPFKEVVENSSSPKEFEEFKTALLKQEEFSLTIPLPNSASSFLLEAMLTRNEAGASHHATLKKEGEICNSTPFETLIEYSHDGYWDWHVQTGYEYMSPRFWEIFGFKPEEKKHSPDEWQDLIFPEDLEIAATNINKHFETKGEYPYYQTVRYHHKNGSTVSVICRGKVIEWDKEGNPVRMVGTHTDVTELVNKKKELQEKVEEINELMHILSHDLKEPVRGVHEYLTLYLMDFEKELTPDKIDPIKKCLLLCEKMSSLIGDISEHAHLSKENKQVELCDLNMLVEEIVSDLLLMHPRNVSITIETSLPSISCDKLQFKILLRNLLSNAIKHNINKEKKVLIGYKDKSLYIKDNGVGIKKEYFNEIFKIFRKNFSDNTSLEKNDSTGSGLAFVKKIADSHNWKIHVESEENKGTTFSIQLNNA